MPGPYLEGLKYQGENVNLMGSEEPLKTLEPESELRAEDKKESDSSARVDRRREDALLPPSPVMELQLKIRRA